MGLVQFVSDTGVEFADRAAFEFNITQLAYVIDENFERYRY